MAAIVGIDLGTTKSAVAFWENGAPHVIADPDGHRIMPSVVAFDPESRQWAKGYQALAIASRSPNSTITSIKRLMGRSFNDEAVQNLLLKKRVLYPIEEASRHRGAIAVSLNGFHVTPQQISAKILQQLKVIAERSLDSDITQAVITVPAYFHDTQRQATRDAGRIAGLEVVRILSEPTAACLAFGYDKRNEARKNIAVYDLGGGTFDISIMNAGGGRLMPFSVRATDGDALLGGDDIDNSIVDWLLECVERSKRALWRDDIVSRSALLIAAKRAKEVLSSQEVTRVQVQGPPGSAAQAEVLDLELTRIQLEQLTQPLIDETLRICNHALKGARLDVADIDEVLLIGSQTHMPAVRQAVGNFFGRTPNTSVPPGEAVALGAAVQAAMLTGEIRGPDVADVVPLSLGVRTKDGKMQKLIERNTSIPIEAKDDFSTTEDNQASIEVRVYQGEHDWVEKNILLASFILPVELAPAKQPHIEITFKVDYDGILHVTAEDVHTGQSKQITVTHSLRLSDEEIEEMVREAESEGKGMQE